MGVSFSRVSLLWGFGGAPQNKTTPFRNPARPSCLYLHSEPESAAVMRQEPSVSAKHTINPGPMVISNRVAKEGFATLRAKRSNAEGAWPKNGNSRTSSTRACARYWLDWIYVSIQLLLYIYIYIYVYIYIYNVEISVCFQLYTCPYCWHV